MSQKIDFTIPFNSLVQYVPQNLRNEVIKGLISNLFDRFMTHDESIPLYGYIGRKPVSSDDRTVKIPQATVERDINAIVPVLNFTLGTEKYAFTVQDLINKATVLGVDSSNQRWLYSQANNYLPPIDIDRFSNFYNYYWIANAVASKPTLSWNPELLPEYYTISSPKPSDSDKLNVLVATTRPIILTGAGFEDQTFTIKFSSPTEFVITANAGLGAWVPTSISVTLTSDSQHVKFDVTDGVSTETLVEFDVVRETVYDADGNAVGTQDFATNDEYLLDTAFLSRNYVLSTVALTPSTYGKGNFKNILALSKYQTIDGVQVGNGDRVLVQTNGPDDGIYIVGPGAWTRAEDYDGLTMKPMARVWVKDGIQNKGLIFVSGFGNSWSTDAVVVESNTNDWQEGNYWVHSSALESYNLSRAEVVQAVRPIIEYNSDIRLNSFAKDGLPSTSGFEFKQKKTEFNQLPMFDLFRYDGTHSGLVSAIFYYVEDLTQELDLDLQKRVKLSTGASSDYVFNHGCADANGDMLFFSKSDALSSIWHAGYTSSVVIDQVFISALEMASGEVKGTLSNLVANDFVQQQVWTLTATSETTFKVSGSKTLNIPDAYKTITVGVPYANIDFSCLIEAGSTPFGVGDTFVFRIGALETPRYVYRDSDEVISDVYGGKIADTANVGAYQVPRPFIFNPYNSARDEVAEGTLYSHFRSIIQNQPSTSLSDFAFGGSIKNWSEQHTLLASLLMQRDLTPISMIDLAQRQYETALSTLGDTYQATIADYFSSVGVIALDGSAAQEAKLNALLDYLLTIRASDNDVRTVLYDTTSSVTGFPITLPQLGILPLVVPTIAFDNVLGQDLIVHHDGHNSPLYVDDVSFRRAVLNNSADTLVERSDGTSTPAVGSFTYDVPVKPYKGTLWIRPNGDDRDMLAFDVDFDSTPLSATVGQTWYDRPSDTLSIWNGVSWDAQPTPLVAWKFVNLANTLNQLIILAETRLYNGINPNSRKVQFDDLINVPEFRTQLERELFTFAANNGLAPLGSNYVASDSFTWNFSSASLADFPALSTATVPARWMNIIKAHHATFGSLVVPTERPNLEPWKLLGFTTYAAWWASLTSGQQASFAPIDNLANLTQASYTNLGSVKAILTPYSATATQGLQIVDGIQLSDGDLVLLQNEVGPENNGIWLVRSGAWTRPQTTMLAKSYVTVESGVENAQTIWVLQNDVTVGVDAQVYSQARRWGSSLWSYIKTQRPGLRLSVDTVRDSLLPPYVNSTLTQSVNALTTVMPSGLANDYVFGDGGPVESAWLSTIDFGYSMARALFRHDPLMFLGFCWGFNWVEVANVLFDGYDINTPGHKRFRLHGDLNRVITRGSENKIIGDGSAYTIVYDAYEVDNTGRYQNFSVRNSDGIAVAYVREGAPYTVGGLQIEIEDNGQPFHIGDKFTVAADGTVSFIPALRYKYLGFGQVFTNALRQMSIDTQDSFAIDAFRNWDVNMGHRAGGLVATDDLKVRTDSDSLSTSSYELIFKKNEISKDTWLQAMRITVLQFGGRKELDSGFAPLADGRDWVFRIEGYNPRYSNITYYDLTTAGDNITFQALGGEKTPIQWLQPTLSSGLTTSYLPLTITGVQNVVNFLFGYKKYVEEQGWNFNRIGSENNIDYRTGRSRTWQLEIEKFIDQCYRGIQVDQGHIVNPFSDEVWLTQNTGLLAEFKDTALFDITGHAAVFDIAGIKMKAEDIHAVRGNESSTIRAVAPMYSIHAQLDEYEHLFVFNNFVEESTQTGVLYDPFSGGRVVTYKFNGRKQASATFRPEFGGHYLVGSEVRQNLQASTDNMASFYDSNKVFENETSSRHALALLGFSTKDYFSDLDISDKTQFNFWRGLIQSKGTNLSVGAYLNNNRFDDAKLDEYWAYKVAEYGDARQNTYPELKLNVDDTLQQFTQLQFDATVESKISNFTQIDRIDESRWFGIDDLDQDAYFKAEVVGTFTRDTIVGEVYTLPFIADKLIGAGFTSINATTVRATDTTMSVVGYGPATPRYNPIKLFNYVANELIEEIPLWHPAFGQHTPTALEGLNIISTQNPAKYNFSTQVVSNNSYDPLRPWGSNEIGRVWFDTRNLEYVPYWDSVIFTNRTERLSRWGALADFATIDVYEWVKSTVPPSEYNALALAQAGDADLDAATRAAGEVAGQETYVRDRIWSIRPVAWSYSGVPVAGAHPSFNASAGVFDTKLDLSGNGLAVLSAGTFASYGITAGMRIGAFDNSTIAPKPMSESIISSNFTKKIVVGGSPNTQVSVSGFDVKVEVEGYAPGLAGQIAFTAPLTSPIQQIDVSGNATGAYTVTPALTVSEINGDLLETVNIADVVGYLNPLTVPAIAPIAGQPYIAAIAGQEFRPARAEVPYIAPVVGQDFVPPTAGQAGYQIVRFNRAKASSDTTGLANTATVFTATVAFDNQAPIALSVVGSAAQTFAQLLESLNTQVPHRPFAISEDGDILVTSSTIGAQSKVSIVSSGATGIFNSLLNFDSIESPVLGIAENPGQPYIADFAGQAFVQADPGQPYVAEVIGQPYIAAVAGQAAVPGTYLAGATVDVIAGSPLSFSISSFGLKITVTPTQTATLPADAVRNAIIDALGTQVSVRDAVVISDVVSVPPEVPNASALSNDPLDQTDPLVAMYGWAAWNVPTQLQLTNDGRQPNSAWKPYLGDLAVQGQIDIAQVTDAVAYSAAPLTLNDGTVVNRYSTTWTDWSVLKNTVLRKTQVTSGALTLTLDDDYVGDAPSFSNIDSAITSVYVNGITQLKANFDIAGGSLTINENSVAFGSNATVIIRKYEPSAEELAFDPDVADNLTFQQQYKQDYEYVSLPVRDSEGSLSSTIYYFWVKNKTTSAFGKKLSIQSMAQELRDGPSNFLTFQTPTSGMLGSGVTSDPYRYDALAISGLSYVVSKDDTFKLRFTRNFTLRDDPQQIDLKDTHAEWSLLRPGQRTKIPEALWQKLIDSVAGQDLAGNAVPALRRSLYDERNGTASQFGFGSEQTLAPKDLLVSSITYTIVNTKLIDTTIPIPGPDFISFLNFDESDTWFATPQAARQTMTDIWTTAKPSQINEIFFAALNDILASNYELSDVFKTSRLSAYSIKVVATAPVQPAYE